MSAKGEKIRAEAIAAIGELKSAGADPRALAAIQRLVSQNVSLAATCKDMHATEGRLRALIGEVRAVVCGVLCPSVKRTGDEWEHVDLCQRLAAEVVK